MKDQPNITLKIKDGIIYARSINQKLNIPEKVLSKLNHDNIVDGMYMISCGTWNSLKETTVNTVDINLSKIRARLLFTTSSNIIDEHEQNVTTPSFGIWRLAYHIATHSVDVDVQVCDPSLGGIRFLEILLKKEEYDLICFSGMSTNLKEDLRLLKIIEKYQPQAIIVFGGVDSQALANWESLNILPIDYIITGHGETIIRDIVMKIDSLCDNKKLQQKNSSPKVLNGPIQLPSIDLDESMLPYGEGDIVHPYGYTSKVLYQKFSNACPETCFWCVSSKDGLVYNDAYEALMAIKSKIRDGWHTDMSVIDNNLSTHQKFIIDLCSLIGKSSIQKLPKHGKLTINGASNELLEALSFAGFIRLSFGVESFDKHVRYQLGKSFSNAEIDKVIYKTIELGIQPEINLIFCSPYETKESISATLIKTAELVLNYKCIVFVVLGLYCTIGTKKISEHIKTIEISSEEGDSNILLPWIFQPSVSVNDLYSNGLDEYNKILDEFSRQRKIFIPNHVKSLLKCQAFSKLLDLPCERTFQMMARKQLKWRYIHV